MTAYIISTAPGDAKEAHNDIYKRTLKEVFNELTALAKDFQKGFFKVQNEKGKYVSCEFSEKFLKDAIKEDTVHVAFGPKGKNHFWANINTVEIQ